MTAIEMEVSDHSKTNPVSAPLEEQRPEATPLNDDNETTFLEGGVKAWLTVASGFCCNFSSFGWVSSIGIFQTHYLQNQLSDYSPAAISWISSMNFFTVFVFAPLVGIVFDGYGPRRILIFGTSAQILGLLCLSFSKEYYQIFLSQSVLSGIGASALCYGGMNAVATHFSRRRALALGMVVSGSSVGGTVLPIMFRGILSSGISFAWTIRITMFLFLALLSFACAACSSNLDHKPRKTSVKRFIRPFDELPYLLVAVASFCTFWGLYIPNNFIILYAESIGMSKSMANYQLAILNATSAFGRIVSGLLADRFGRFNVMVINLTFVTILVPALWLVGTRETLMAFSVCFGFGSGSFISLGPSIVAQISKIEDIGLRTGMVFFVSSFASLTGNPIGSSLSKSGYLGMQAFCCASIGVGATIFVLARLTQSRKLLEAV